MALEGSLTDFGLADILQLIYFQRKTGILTLEGRTDRVRLLFIEGNIAGAESKKRLEDNRLGKILTKKGYLSEADLQAALEEHERTGVKFGLVLLQRELVGKEILTEILKSQITETVIQLFGWKQGAYEFLSQGVPQDKDLPCSVDTQYLLMEGLRIMDEWSVIKGKITLDMIFTKKTEAPSDLTEDEKAVFSYVDGENDVSTIIDLSGRDNFHVSKTLLALADNGLIEAVEQAPVFAEEPVAATRKPSNIMNYLTQAAIFLSLALSLLVMLAGRGDVFRKFRAAQEIEDLRFRIEKYRLEHPSYPKRLEEVISHTEDPWGRPYIYGTSVNSFVLGSAGPDGKEGTPDDVY
jgi:hypothetical protein